jgi:hypothetical protein
MITIPLYNDTVIAPPTQMMVPSTLAMPSLLKIRTSSNPNETASRNVKMGIRFWETAVNKGDVNDNPARNSSCEPTIPVSASRLNLHSNENVS